MRLESIEHCPINDVSGEIAYANVPDWFFSTDGTWTYYRDRETGHLWLNPRPANDEIAGLYREYYTHRPDGDGLPTTWDRAVALILHRTYGYPIVSEARLAARIVSRLPTVSAAAMMEVAKLPPRAGRRLLDFGCGSGRFMRRMNNAGWEVCGVEPDPKAVEMLRVKQGFVVRTSLEDASDWVGSFDVIVLNHVIEHVPEPIAVLQQLVKFLAPGGELLITTPNAASLGCRIFGRYWRGLEAPRHFNVFTPASIDLVLRACGLATVEMSTETRLARGLFFSSVFAARKYTRIELEPRRSRLVKLAGYAFQIIEAALTKIYPELGEEIYCRARIESDSIGALGAV